MRIAVAASALLHLGLIVATMIAWPGLTAVQPTPATPSIDIELVEIAEETNIKPQIKKPEPPEEEPEPPKEEPEPELPKEEPKPAPAAEPEPAEPEPEPEIEPEPAEPEAKEEKPEPPKEEKKPDPPKPAPVKPTPKAEPKEEDFFTQARALIDKTPREEQQERVFYEDGEDTLTGETNREGVGLKNEMTMSPVDAVKAQVIPCNNIGAIAGHKNAESYVIKMTIYFNPDGTLKPGVENPRIWDQGRFRTDSGYRAATEAAVQAIRQCEGDGYNVRGLPELTMIFDPTKMLGAR